MFLRKNQGERRKASLLDEMMEESDGEEEDGGGDEEAAAVQQSFSAKRIECSGFSAAPPAGQLALLEGPDCSMNGGHEGEQMFGCIHQRDKKTKHKSVLITGHRCHPSDITDAGTRYRYHILVCYIRYILQVLQILCPGV